MQPKNAVPVQPPFRKGGLGGFPPVANTNPWIPAYAGMTGVTIGVWFLELEKVDG